MNGAWRLAACLVLAAATVVCAAGPHDAQGTGSRAGSSAASTCEALEQQWFAAPALPSGIASAQSIGDCWVRSQRIDAATGFYRRLKRTGTRACDREGTACELLASQELRRIDCGGDWLAPSAEEAWKGFLRALADERGDPRSSHLFPDVRAWSDRETMLSERCPAGVFAVPAALKADRQRVANRIGGDSRPWEARSIAVPLAAGDLPWKNYSPDIYRFVGIKACPSARPVAGAPAGGYFIELVPLENERLASEIKCNEG